MAAISPISIQGTIKKLRTVTAQATVGQTDWLLVPQWAIGLNIYFNLTAVAGTTPISVPAILALGDPLVLDDTNVVGPITLSSGSSITAASQHFYQVRPGVSGISNAGDAPTADGWHSFNMQLPGIIGIQVLNDRTTGDETYTYTLVVEFKK